jgi:hypothetical protein
MKRTTQEIKIFWHCLCLAYWALLPQFYLVYTPGNRHSLAWTHGMYGVILLVILAVGTVYFLIAKAGQWIAAHSPNAGRYVHIGLGGVWGMIILRTIFSLLDKGTVLPISWQTVLNATPVKAGLYVLPFLAVARFPRVAGGGGRILSAGLGVLLALYLVVPWTWATYGWDGETPPPPKPEHQSATNSIYIFLFDAWTHSRTFSNGDLQVPMPNLAELLGHADIFHGAQSCGSKTFISMPRFLHQNDEAMRQLSYNEIRKLAENNQFGRNRFRSIFDITDRHYKAVLGLYYHYPSSVGDRVDYCGKYSPLTERKRYQDYLISLLASQYAFVRHVGITMPPGRRGWTWDANVAGSQLVTRKEVLDLLGSLPPRSMAFFHIPFPHWPYQFNPDGTLRDRPLGEESDYSNMAAYQDNMIYMDLLLGEFLSVLKQRGVYDSSMIVLLSDHVMGNDPNLDYPSDYQALEEDDRLPWSTTRHVPLIVKHPNQDVSRRMEQPVYAWDLHYLFSLYINHPTKTIDFKWWEGVPISASDLDTISYE